MKRLWDAIRDTVVGLGALALMAAIGVFFLWQIAGGFGNVLDVLVHG